VVALSTAEVECIALSMAVQEAVWLMRMLFNLEMDLRPVIIIEDNQSDIALTNNPVAHARTKHIDIRYQFVREAVT